MHSDQRPKRDPRSQTATDASAPGNLFLCGEYAVLSGAPALVVAPSLRCHVRCVRLDEPMIVIESDALGRLELPLQDQGFIGSADAQSWKALVGLLNACIASRSLGFGLSIQIMSELPVGAGMSSSTAVLAATATAICESVGALPTPPILRRLAFPWQEVLHGGRASGAEFYSSLYGGVHWIEGQSGTRLEQVMPPIIVADTGLRRSTGVVTKSYRSKEGFVQEISGCAERCRDALKEENWSALGRTLTEVHRLLGRLGAGHALLDQLVVAAEAAGAWGAKLSGAGRGGVMFALAPAERLEAVVQALVRAGAVGVWITCVDSDGVRLDTK